MTPKTASNALATDFNLALAPTTAGIDQCVPIPMHIVAQGQDVHGTPDLASLRRPHFARIDSESCELHAVRRKELACDLKIFGRKCCQNVTMHQQTPIGPSPKRRELMPAVVDPDTLRDQLGPSLTRKSK